jgi:sporulation protein YlmC with PRC-barrel domain
MENENRKVMRDAKTRYEEYTKVEALEAKYIKSINGKYYTTLKNMRRDIERGKMGGNKHIHRVNAINNSQQG